MTTLTLVRGPSGSGKSTVATALVNMMDDAFNYEADMYFYDEWGNYIFDKNKLHLAHRWCEDMTRKALEMGYDVVVSNTFTRLSEMKAYYKLAKELGADLNIITCQGPFKNVHNVPDTTLAAQKERMFHGDVIAELGKLYGY